VDSKGDLSHSGECDMFCFDEEAAGSVKSPSWRRDFILNLASTQSLFGGMVLRGSRALRHVSSMGRCTSRTGMSCWCVKWKRKGEM